MNAGLKGRAGLVLLAALTLAPAAVVGGARAVRAQVIASDTERSAAREPERPDYQRRRFDEDWSGLRDVDLAATADAWDRLKFIRLTPDGSVWLTLAGQVRERVEYFRQYLFGSSTPTATDAYLLTRVRASADLHVTPALRVYVEGLSAFALGRDLVGGRTPTFVDELALLNAFAEFALPLGERASVTLRGGRQEFGFGAQRLVGASDWGQTRRTYDGALGVVRAGGWVVSPFWAQVAAAQKYEFNASTADRQLFGVYASGSVPRLSVGLDLYWIGVDNASAAFNGTSGPEQRHTLGGRTWGPLGRSGLDFELEGAAQVGTVGRERVAAAMVTGALGYALPWLSPARVYVNVDYGSGDAKPGGRVGTLNPLYPSQHTYLGDIDFIARPNIVSPSAGLIVTPFPDLTVTFHQYFFWRASDRDALYGSSGGILRPGTTTRARYVGAEIDLLASYDFTRHLLGYAGYSHFFTGDFIRKTGPARDGDFFYWALQYTF